MNTHENIECAIESDLQAASCDIAEQLTSLVYSSENCMPLYTPSNQGYHPGVAFPRLTRLSQIHKLTRLDQAYDLIEVL